MHTLCTVRNADVEDYTSVVDGLLDGVAFLVGEFALEFVVATILGDDVVCAAVAGLLPDHGRSGRDDYT